MSTLTEPTKFVEPTNSHLFCKICRGLFREPVINVKCGHSFCRECIQREADGKKAVQCPQDQVTCEISFLVVNRSVQSQIEDLLIYCCHGIRWCNIQGDYEIDPDGCKERIKYGSRQIHESVCPYALVPCPNSESVCGHIRQSNLTLHLKNCHHFPCNYLDKGCSFTGSQSEVDRHVVLCGYRGLQAVVVNDNNQEIHLLQRANNKLQKEVDTLMVKVLTLEEANKKVVEQLENCLSQMSALKEQQNVLNDRMERTLVQLPISLPSPKDKTMKAAQVSIATSPIPSLKEITWTMPFQFKCIGTLRGHRNTVNALVTHKNLLFSAGGDNVIKVWDLEQLLRGCQQTIPGHDDKIHCLAVGLYLYSSGADTTIRSWNLGDFSQVNIVENAHDNIVAALVCNEKFLFSSSHTVIKVWDARTLEPLQCMSGLKHWVRSLALSKNQEYLYSGSHNTIEIWDATGTGKFNLRGKITHTYGSVHSLALTNKYIIAGTYNNNTHLFDIIKQEHVNKLSGHVGAVLSLAVKTTGDFLFTCSTDSNIQLWNLENFLPISMLSRHEDSVNCVIVYNDLLISASDDMEIKMFKYYKMPD